MELYHGSNIEVAQPLALAGRRNLDFGRGFYTTRHKSQALDTKKTNNQICFRNQEAIDKFLHFTNAETVTPQDIEL